MKNNPNFSDLTYIFMEQLKTMAQTSLVFHTRLNARFKERMLNFTRKTFHRTNQDYYFLRDSFSNSDHAREPIQCRRGK